MFTESKLTMEEKDKLIEKISKNDSNITVAVFDTFPLSTQDIKNIVAGIKNNSTLLALKLLDCRITEEHIELLAQGIKENSSLTEVVIEKFQDDNEKIIRNINFIKQHVENNKSKNSTIDMKRKT